MGMYLQLANAKSIRFTFSLAMQAGILFEKRDEVKTKGSRR